MTLTLTYDLDLQSPASYGHDLSCANVQDQRSVGSEDRVETDGRMDRRTEVIALFAQLTTALFPSCCVLCGGDPVPEDQPACDLVITDRLTVEPAAL